MRLSPLLILGVLLATQVVEHRSAVAETEFRNSIALFRYRGASGDAARPFDAFRGLIEHKIENLRDHVESALAQDANDSKLVDYMGRLFVRYIDEDNLRNDSQAYNWMQVEVDVLQVLRGTIMPNSNQDGFMIFTRCLFIEDPSHDRRRDFKINLALTPEEFANTKDSHSLVILYSVAIEARRLGVEREEIAPIVAEALNAIADLERRTGTLQGDMQEIKEAWQEFKNAL